MKVIVDIEMCCGHAECEEVAPEIFRVGDDAVAHVLTEHPGEKFRDKAEEAVWRCPAGAIRLESELSAC